MNTLKLTDKLFSGVSGLGALFVLTEAVLQSMGKSICSTEGCHLVASYARYGDASILLFGILLFAVLFLLSINNLKRGNPALDNFINLALVVSLASEGFFTGYQAFRLHAACVFCLIVFGFIVVLGLLRLLSGHREMFAGFASLIAVFSLFYLVLPAQQTIALPSDKKMVLFYSEGCKYCAEVLKAIEENKLPVDHVIVKEYTGFLKSMGIESVPTLYVNNDNEKIFLTGKDSILTYLAYKQTGTASKPAKTEKRQPNRKNKANEQGQTFNLEHLGGQTGQTFTIIVPSSDKDACSADEECK
jgi:uncharacterized membrane protein/glutaredoxin